MILFGIVEIVTGFTHNFVGISTSTTTIMTYSGATIGAFYSIAGFLTLTVRRWAANAAMVLLVADIVGRVALVVTGLFPLNSTENLVGIVGGTSLAVIFAVYIWVRRAVFR
jgi:hypothetical protein